MLNCVPQEIAVTVNYLLDKSEAGLKRLFEKYPRIYVHWPTLYEKIKGAWISNEIVHYLLEMWEEDKLIPIPHGDDIAELPAIVSLDYKYPDNVKVYCQTAGEYIELRKNFGKEDIGGF